MSEPRIKGRLESKELTGLPKPVQDKLNACLASDAAHIKKGQPGGAHVKAIQQALKTIRSRNPSLKLPDINDPEGEYGRDTAAAVLQYKAVNDIKRTGQPLDAIVGRMTLTRIDDELVNGPTPSGPKTVIIDAVPVEIASFEEDLEKDDLTFKPVPNSELSGKELRLIIDMRKNSTSELEGKMRSDLVKGGMFGTIFLDKFIANATPPSSSFAITHAAGSEFSNLVASTQVFKANSSNFRKQLDKEIKELGKSGPFPATQLKDRVEAPLPSWSPQGIAKLGAGLSIVLFGPDFQGEQERMLILIGSFQSSHVLLSEFVMNPNTRDYTGTLFYVLIDHFGVDTSDIIFDGRGHGSDSQVAFWVLQHERHSPGHMPFRMKVIIREEIAGSF